MVIQNYDITDRRRVKEKNIFRVIVENKMIFVGIGLGALFWIMESLLHVYIFHHGNIAQQIITPNLNELWMRSLVGCVLIIFGIYSHFVMTKIQQTEEVLRENEECFRSVTETVTDAIVIINSLGNIVFWNRAAEMFFGYSADEIVGQPLTVIMPERSHEVYKKGLKRVVSTGKSNIIGKTVEIIGQRKDGREFPIELSLATVKIREVTLFASIIRDITERKRAEERVIRRNAVLDAINKVFRETLTCETDEEVARTCLAVAEELTDSKFGFIGEVNQAGRFDTIALTDPGWDACRIPKSDAVVLIKDMEIRGIWGGVIKDEQSSIVNNPAFHPDRVGTPEGHPPLTSFLGVPLKRVGRTIGMIGLANKESGYDLADQQTVESLSVAFVEALYRKRAEEKIKEYAENLENLVEERTVDLRESEERYRGLYESSIDGIASADLEGNIVECNQAFADMLGYTKEELYNLTLWDITPSNWYDMNKQIFSEEVFAKGFSEEYEKEYIRKDGTIVPICARAWVIKDKDGNPVGSWGIVRDITERKKLDQMKERFISVATHELRTPLISIKGYVDYIQSGNLGSLSELIDSSLKVVSRNTDRLLHLTNDLLDIQRIKSGEFHLEVEPLNFIELLDHCAEEIRPIIDEKRQNFHLETPDEPLLIQGDRIRLSQAIMNVLNNATKFTPEGGSITLRVEEEDSVIQVEVSDTGIGLRKKDLERVFQPFADIEKSTYIKGTGLGLSVTKGIIEAHRGEIWVHSEDEGKGATFTFTLPKRGEKR